MLENINTQIVMTVIIAVMGMSLFFGVFWLFQRYQVVKLSVGWDFINSFVAVKRRRNFDLVLRIKSPAGKEEYQFVKQSPIINYDWTMKGQKVKKSVIFDERAVDYMNGTPVLNVTPLDIRPIDRDTGLLVNVPSEIIEKLAVDSSRSAEGEEKKDKLIKTLIYAIIGMGVIFFIALTYINQTNSDLQVQLAQCSIELGKSATVIAG